MTEPLHVLVEGLPQNSLTTRLLGALDWVVPGEWRNITVFEDMIKEVTGEEDQGVIQQVGERAMALWNDPAQGYQRAVAVYQGVDHVATGAGLASLFSMVADRVELFEKVRDVAPKPDTVQAVDAAVKLAAELVAFTLTNGIPGDSLGDFSTSVAAYAKEERIRMVAWLAFDCIIPLGPDFLAKIFDALKNVEADALANHRVFRFVAEHLPGDLARKKQLVEENVADAGERLSAFATDRGMTREGLLAKVREYVDVADDKLDVIAAALDLTTNTFEHTGIQTVARRIVSRAYGEI
jgi:hypothetical protein